MNTDKRCENDSLREAMPRARSFGSAGRSRGYGRELRCPKCGGSDLKKVSLAYQEGVYRVHTRSRVQGFLFGGDGPDVIVGRTVTEGVQQTELSKRLRPPTKWSYIKLMGWWAAVSVTVLIVYVHSVTGSSTRVSSPTAVVGMFIVGIGFLVSLILVWSHNNLVYPKQYAEWNDSWLCRRCGGVSYHARR
jgi:hypothetical protein